MQKILDNDLVEIRKDNVTLTDNKSASWNVYLRFKESIVHYDNIKNRSSNKSRLLFTDTDSLMYEIKTEDV